jgi:hypothetical protein
MRTHQTPGDHSPAEPLRDLVQLPDEPAPVEVVCEDQLAGDATAVYMEDGSLEALSRPARHHGIDRSGAIDG